MDAAKSDLLRALGRLVRGLSALFWGIPLTLIMAVETARTDWLGFLGPAAFAPVFVLSGILWHGLSQLRDFQKQERIWQQALHRAEFFAIINTGLAPFLFWWHRFPFVPFYTVCVAVLAVTGVLFLAQLNQVLRRLSAMLPDEMLRAETRTFTAWNIGLFWTLLASLGLYALLRRFPIWPGVGGRFFVAFQERAEELVLFLILMPVAVTLSLLWKIKEAIFASLFQTER